MIPKTIFRVGFWLAAFAALSASTAAWAHNPVAECKAIDEQTIKYEGGFSDGSKAAGVTLDVISYDEQVLVPVPAGARSLPSSMPV